MTQDPHGRRPRLVSIPREEIAGPTTPTDPPIAHAPLPEGPEKLEERVDLAEGRVDALISDVREVRADAKLGVAIGMENRSEILEVKAGVFEILGYLRSVDGNASGARQESVVARVEAAESRKEAAQAKADAAHALREAHAAREAATRQSQAEILIHDAGAKLLGARVETTIERERAETRVVIDDAKATSRARQKVLAGAVALVLVILAALGVAFRDRITGAPHSNVSPPVGLERTP